MPYCCVPYCRSRPVKGSGIPFHEFPVDEELREKWLKCISREGTAKGTKFIPNDKSNSSLVCGLHFRDGDYRFSFNGDKTNKLNKNALPTRFLNYSELERVSEQIDRKRVSRNSTHRTCGRRKRAISLSEETVTKIKVEQLDPSSPSDPLPPSDTNDHSLQP